ncbi:unnamed protein product [Ostreobium quekettii]|uniref:Acid phosphatase n=1 Tax=Ostreobium quekettii TaxID=121088 RepID=A0A8S1J6T7_9CHLO|nr:unnamed protein product [Ostreobium quekettii]|eukprot:evm.model.scf_602.1 EVM.evm.TU.scf_602.1   scf_602:40559-41954(+)
MNFEGVRQDFDYDRVGEKGGRGGPLKRRWMVACACVGALALALFVLVVVALARPRRACEAGESLAFHCLYALGGGVAHKDSLNFPQLQREECASTFERYFEEGGQYERDLDIALNAAQAYFGNATLFPEVNSSMVAIFDVDETCLSNLEDMRNEDWDREYSKQKSREWMLQARAPAIPQTLAVYKMLWKKGFGLTFITGRSEELHNATAVNLKKMGYGSACSKDGKGMKGDEPCYMELGMRNNSTDVGKKATIYKSEKREAFLEQHKGSQFVAAFGDQFSDLLGEFGAAALFKLPNPVYYIV